MITKCKQHILDTCLIDNVFLIIFFNALKRTAALSTSVYRLTAYCVSSSQRLRGRFNEVFLHASLVRRA